MKDLNLTPLETKTLTAFIDELYAEPGFSDVDAKDLSKITGIPTKSIRGVIGSLVQKGILSTVETDSYGAPEQFVIIYLNEAYWYLHPEWKEEYDHEKYGKKN
jgi:hypothetical protein